MCGDWRDGHLFLFIFHALCRFQWIEFPLEWLPELHLLFLSIVLWMNWFVFLFVLSQTDLLLFTSFIAICNLRLRVNRHAHRNVLWDSVGRDKRNANFRGFTYQNLKHLGRPISSSIIIIADVDTGKKPKQMHCIWLCLFGHCFSSLEIAINFPRHDVRRMIFHATLMFITFSWPSHGHRPQWAIQSQHRIGHTHNTILNNNKLCKCDNTWHGRK